LHSIAVPSSEIPIYLLSYFFSLKETMELHKQGKVLRLFGKKRRENNKIIIDKEDTIGVFIILHCAHTLLVEFLQTEKGRSDNLQRELSKGASLIQNKSLSWSTPNSFFCQKFCVQKIDMAYELPQKRDNFLF
jgi:hypothetical protein